MACAASCTSIRPCCDAAAPRLTEHLIAADIDAWRQAATSVLAAGSSNGWHSISDAHHAVRILQQHDSTASLHRWRGSWCGTAATAMHGSQGLAAVYHSLSVAKALDCGTPASLSTSAQDQMQAGLAGTALDGLYYGALVADTVGAHDAFSPELLIRRVSVLVDARGAVASDDVPTAPLTSDNAYAAAELLALLADRVDAASTARRAASAALSHIAALAKADSAAGMSDATLLAPLLSTPAAAAAVCSTPPLIDATALRGAAVSLLSARRCGGDVVAAWRVSSALHALAGIDAACRAALPSTAEGNTTATDAASEGDDTQPPPPLPQPPRSISFSPPSVTASALRSGGGSAALSVTTVLGADPGGGEVAMAAGGAAVIAVTVRSVRKYGSKAVEGAAGLTDGALTAERVAAGAGGGDAAGRGLWRVRGLGALPPGRYITEVCAPNRVWQCSAHDPVCQSLAGSSLCSAVTECRAATRVCSHIAALA